MLALLEHSVSELGGTYVMEDTDSMAIVATERGGLVRCARYHGDKTALDKAHVGPWDSVLEKYDQTPRHQFMA
jgi:hypothetical protein